MSSPAATPPSSRPPRRRRWRFFVLGAFTGFLFACALLCLPAVQRTLAERAIGLQPGWRLRLAHLSAGPTGVDADGVAFAMPGIEAHSEPILIRLAPGQLLLRRELRVERIEARKLRVVLTPAQLAAGDPAAVFAGVLPLLQSPLPWSLDTAELDGEILVRDAGASLVVGTFRITGGGVTPERAGEFHYELACHTSLLPTSTSAQQLRSHGTLRVTQAADHGLARLELDGELTLPPHSPLALPPAKLHLTVAAAPHGETYSARLDFASSASLAFTGQLDTLAATLTGHVTSQATSALAASLLGDATPAAELTLAADLTADLRSGDATLTCTGDLAARDWQKLRPALAVVDALTARFAATFAKRAGTPRLESASITVRGESSPFTVTAALTQPLPLNAFPADAFATLAVEHAPLAWANPWLASSGFQLSPAELSGAWSLARTPEQAWLLTATRPCATTPFTLKGASVPLLPPVRLEFSPKFTVSTARAAAEIGDFTVVTDNRDKIASRMTADFDFATRAFHTAGRIRGQLPTFLADSEHPLPFSLVTQWDLTLRDTRLDVQTFEFAARRRALPDPFLSLQLLRPLAVDTAQLTALDAEAGDWLRLKFNGLQLGWISRWLPGRRFAGTLAAGESILRSSAEGALTLESVVPWRITDASFAIGGRTLFTGELGLKPGFAFHVGQIAADLAELTARDTAGNRAQGRVSVTAGLHERRATARIDVRADLPQLPHGADTFGRLRAHFRATAHNESDTIAVMDTFNLRVRNAERDLLVVDAPQPFLFGLSNTGLFTAATLAPLRLSTSAFPLAWIQPWLPRTELRGTFQGGEFLLTAQLTKYSIRPLKPLRVTDAFVIVDGRELVHDATVSLQPGLDATLLFTPLPTFQLAYSGTNHLTNGSVDIAGRHALDLDFALGFIGDDRHTLPNSLDLTARVDFAPLTLLPVLAGRGLPAAGHLVARVNGDMLGQQPVEAWVRLSGIPAPDEKRLLADLELTARGRVKDGALAGAGVTINLATQPRPTDVRFGGRFSLHETQLDLASGLKSDFLDARELLAYAKAFSPPTPEAETALSVATAPVTPTYPQLGHPFWSTLRGRFTLNVGTLQFAPYRIDGLHGRLELGDRELRLRDLRGEMFAGRWSGDVQIAYDPANPTADHALTGTFRIEQFDSARVVQTAFPNQLASLEARIDVQSTFRSHGNAAVELIDRAEGEFTVDGAHGIVRLTVPKQDTLATAAVFGGTLLLSPELRALGRLLKQFAEMPVDRIRISGQRTEDGAVALNEFRVDSPQARLFAHGAIVPGDTPLMERPLQLSIDLAAKDDMAVILGGMNLLERKPRDDGYRPLKETFTLGGKAGAPDTGPLYDLLAKGVMGSKGTWGLLMRKVQAEVEKSKNAPPKKTAALTP